MRCFTWKAVVWKRCQIFEICISASDSESFAYQILLRNISVLFEVFFFFLFVQIIFGFLTESSNRIRTNVTVNKWKLIKKDSRIKIIANYMRWTDRPSCARPHHQKNGHQKYSVILNWSNFRIINEIFYDYQCLRIIWECLSLFNYCNLIWRYIKGLCWESQLETMKILLR